MKSSSASAAVPSGLPHVGNRRRNGYELTKQRDMVPIALGAGSAAVVLHILAWVYCPALLTWGGVEPLVVEEVKPEEEVVRVVVREKTQEEMVHMDPVQEMPEEEPQEIIEAEPLEIDILDLEHIDELSIMPGETKIALPQPAVKDEGTEAGEQMAPAPVELSSLPMPDVPPAVIDAPEPAPVNSNEVVANITAQPDHTDEDSALIEKSLREEAGKNNTPLPGDTRSLAELMGIENPGARSGVARLGADVLFAFDKCQLKNSARITMLQLAALILKNPGTNFIIEGHTDSFGSEDYNALLSLQRAAAVREWLTKNGVPVNNVYIRPCGNNNPLADTKGDQNSQLLNRRVEIHMRRAGEALPPGCAPHTEKVDTTTPVRTQLARGVRVPEAYASAYGKKPAAPAGNKASAPAENKAPAPEGSGQLPAGNAN